MQSNIREGRKLYGEDSDVTVRTITYLTTQKTATKKIR